MKRLGNIIILFMFACIMLLGEGSANAAFEKNKGLPGILVCEINGYGENVLRQEYFYTFEELLIEKLQEKGKFSVQPKAALGTVLHNGRALQLDEFFSELHKYAITNGKNFDKDQACMELVQYCQENPEQPAKEEVYPLAKGFLENVKLIGRQHDVQYLAFCNLKNVDVKLKNHQVNPNFEDLKGMKIMVDMDYYVINANTGKIYEGHSFTDKTTQVFNLLLAKYGKQFDVQQLVQCVLETQAERAADDIAGKGLSKVKENE